MKIELNSNEKSIHSAHKLSRVDVYKENCQVIDTWS